LHGIDRHPNLAAVLKAAANLLDEDEDFEEQQGPEAGAYGQYDEGGGQYEQLGYLGEAAGRWAVGAGCFGAGWGLLGVLWWWDCGSMCLDWRSCKHASSCLQFCDACYSPQSSANPLCSAGSML
jgi:hypothetical protein